MHLPLNEPQARHCMIVVVVYKRRLADSPLIQAVRTSGQAANIYLHIWDNSPPEFLARNREEADSLRGEFGTILYSGTGNNTPLSEVYNSALTAYFARPSARYALIFDQDSCLETEFLEKIEMDVIENMDHPVLIVPRVKSIKSGTVISPRRQRPYYLFRRYVFSPDFADVLPGRYLASSLFAVGSGLVITKMLWNTGLRFDVNLNFYGVDTEFCTDYYCSHSEFVFSGATIFHNISEEESEDVKVKQWRFAQHMRYWKYQLQKHSPYPKILTDLYVDFFHFAFRSKQRMRRLLRGK